MPTMTHPQAQTLPMLDAEVFLADGGLETTLIFEDGLDLPDFAAFTRTVAAIHAVDWQALGLEFIGVPATAGDGIRRELAAVAARMLRDGVSAGGRLPARVYRATGRPCPRCGTPIRCAPQGEQRRTTWWCPACCS